ncbi:MAG: DoxX family protein [Chitinophagaceae bacterium]|nr:DoxX family protein [Chitinophagaceae bacterium]
MNKFFSSAPVWEQAGLLLIRVTLGVFLVYHGWEIFNEAKMNEYLAWDNFNNSNGKLLVYAGKAAELVAGILFVLGLFTRLASLFTIGTMCYIAFFLGNGIIWNNDQHPFLFVLLALVFFFIGPGRFSFDHYLFKPKTRY